MRTFSRFAIAVLTVSALVVAGANPAMADSKSKPVKDKSVSKVVKKTSKKTSKKVAAKKSTVKSKAKAKKAKTASKSVKASKKSVKLAPQRIAAVDPSAPTIDSISVESGAPGDEVTLNGSNLLDYASVDFGGVPADVVYSLDEISLTAIIPDGALTGPITVTLNDGQMVSSKEFTIVDLVDPYPTDEPSVDPYPTDEPTVLPTPTDEPTIEPTPTDEPTVLPTPSDAWAIYMATVTQAQIDYKNTVQAAQDQFDSATADARAARDAAFASATSFNDFYQAVKTYRLATAVQQANLDADLGDAQQALQAILAKAFKTLIASNPSGGIWLGGPCLDRDDNLERFPHVYGKPHMKPKPEGRGKHGRPGHGGRR